MAALLTDLNEIGATVPADLARVRERMAELDSKRSRLHEALISVDESWSHSNLGYHADLYFEDFVRPPLGRRFDPEWGSFHGLPEGWRDRDLPEVRSAVEQSAGVAVDEYTNAATQLAEEVKKTLTEVAIVAAPIRGMNGLDAESELLSALEGADLEPSVPVSVPGGMSRDSRAIAEGQRLAPHQHVRHEVKRAARSIDASEKAMTLADRLCRQLAGRLRQQAEQTSPNDAETAAVGVAGILRRFDQAARALQGRQRGRRDYEIADEYDVQDLVHGILSLHFEDVRPEEWTPSYAGSSSRIDFLLKRERVVVEVKMTRANLRDREVGEELAIDAIRYRAHPDATVLICFVYDPDHVIQNPRGIEDDLAEISDGQLQVLAVIT